MRENMNLQAVQFSNLSEFPPSANASLRAALAEIQLVVLEKQVEIDNLRFMLGMYREKIISLEG